MVAYSFMRRFYAPIRVGLGLPIEPERGIVIAAGQKIRPKFQTIRLPGKRRHAVAGEILQLYHSMRTSQCFKNGDARCKGSAPIKLFLGASSIGVDIDGDYFCNSTRVLEFVWADGFDDEEDMLRFWAEKHPGIREFSGVLVKWEPLA